MRELPGWQQAEEGAVLERAARAVAVAAGGRPRRGAAAGEGCDRGREARQGADAVLGFCSPELLAAGPRIRWIQAYSAGVERCVAIPALRERGVLLTNMQRVAGAGDGRARAGDDARPSRAACSSTSPSARPRAGRAKLPAAVRMVTLEGKTVLVVGLGGIGVEVAKRAHALGMRVDRDAGQRARGSAVRELRGPAGRAAASSPAEADFVVNTAPLTPATTGMFDAKFFAAVKPGAFFVNVGRGRSVVQAELVAALKSGRSAGAGLDVTDPEPLPADSPLWQMQNVILTPHVSAESDVDDGVRFAILRRTCVATWRGRRCCRWWTWRRGIDARPVESPAFVRLLWERVVERPGSAGSGHALSSL